MFSSLFQFLAEHLLYFALHLSGSSFPSPLSAAEERRCFEALKKGGAGAEAARADLINHNLRLVAHIVKKYYAPSGDQDDLISIGTIGLIKAVDTFDINKGARFATYASRCIENEILMEFRSSRRRQTVAMINDPIESDGDGNALTILDVLKDDFDLAADFEQKADVRRLKQAIEARLAGRERLVVAMRYGLFGHTASTQQQVAEKLGISRSYVSRIEKKALKMVREEFERTA